MTSTGNSLKREQLQTRLGYTFEDEQHLTLALTHRSAGKRNNERLEFLGDSLINHIIAERLYQQFPKAAEGQLSRLRAKLVRGTYLAQVATELDIGSCLVLGTGERKSGGRHRDSILADTLEAIAGAMLLDSHFAKAREVVLRWFEQSLAELTLSDERDAKTRLQEWLQGRAQPLPDYGLVSVTGPDHDQCFTVSCTVAPLPTAIEGQGRSRREAEQAAAAKALEELES